MCQCHHHHHHHIAAQLHPKPLKSVLKVVVYHFHSIGQNIVVTGVVICIPSSIFLRFCFSLPHPVVRASGRGRGAEEVLPLVRASGSPRERGPQR